MDLPMTPETPALSAEDIRIEAFTPDHLQGGLRLSQAVSWPHRIEDWALNLSVSEGVVACADGAVVGTALCSPFGEVATLNMIIVDGRMQGRGLGRKLMERIIALGGDRELRLVATAEGQPLYEKLGFMATGRILQHQGLPRPATPELPVRTGSAADAARLAQMDHAASNMSREGLITTIATQGEVLLADAGFAILRDFGRGKVLGPVVAGDTATARALMAEAATRCAGTFLRIDLTEAASLSDHAETLGLAHVGGGTAMRKAPRPAEGSGLTTYALVSQALG